MVSTPLVFSGIQHGDHQGTKRGERFDALHRDRAHPSRHERRFKCTPEAWAFVDVQPRTSEYIFPCDPMSIGAAVTRACRLLEIQDQAGLMSPVAIRRLSGTLLHAEGGTTPKLTSG